MKRGGEGKGVISFREGLARAAAMARPRAPQLSLLWCFRASALHAASSLCLFSAQLRSHSSL